MKSIFTINILLIFVIKSSLYSSKIARNHLEPEDSHLANLIDDSSYREYNDIMGYPLEVVKVFSKVFDRNVSFRVFITPSFTPEYAIAVKREGEKYLALKLTIDSPLWLEEHLRMFEDGRILMFDLDEQKVEDAAEPKKTEKQPTKRNRSVETTEFLVEIDKETYNLLSDLWSDMILSTRYPTKPRLVEDGTTYHFSMWIRERGTVSGETSSPDSNSQTGILVEIAELLSDLCESNNNMRSQIIEKIKEKANILNLSLTLPPEY